MDLHGIYALSEVINTLVDGEKITREDAEAKLVVNVEVSPQTHYGIDKEFYRQSNNDSVAGFEHTNEPLVTIINGVTFVIVSSEVNNEEKQ